MTAEPFPYRARKWAIQRFSTVLDRADQHARLNQVDWDVVVVLDACRWDTLNGVAEWPIEYARSPASSTDQWLRSASESEVFEGANVAAGNVKYEFVDVGASKLAKLWETDWDAELGTVLPEPVLEQADEFLLSGDTQVVAHLLPPHAPYVVRIGDEWLPVFPETEAWDQRPDPDADDRVSAQVAMATGRVDLSRAREAYRASVASTWTTVTRYVGKWVKEGHDVVLTADHGETFGGISDLFLYGHPNQCHVDPLIKVPFERFSLGERREQEDITVDQKLKALGYVE